MKKSLTTGAVARLCGVNHRTVLRWIKAGYLNAFQLPGRGDNRVPIDDCVRFLREHDIPVPPELEEASRPLRALVVEDDKAMAVYLGRLLENEGFVVDTAFDGFEAGAMLGTVRPDLLLLDLKIPRLNGFQVLKFVKENPDFADTKVLIVSSAPREDLDQAIAAGAHAALAKPFALEDFREQICALTGNGTRRKRSAPAKQS
jgi:two-component system response regulator VicR